MRASMIAEVASRKSVGDIFEFGRYMVQAAVKPYKYPAKIYKSMEWYVLAREGSRMLLLSKDCVDWEFIDGTGHPQTWENCFARKELLPAFFKDTFTEEEKSLIIPVWLETKDNVKFGTKGGEDTTDQIFFLSIEEFQKYVFPEAARSSLYMVDRLTEDSEEQKEEKYELWHEPADWWLRSPGEEQYCNAVVSSRGDLWEEGLENGADEVGIRPAIWIDLTAAQDDELPF